MPNHYSSSRKSSVWETVKEVFIRLNSTNPGKVALKAQPVIALNMETLEALITLLDDKWSPKDLLLFFGEERPAVAV